MFFRRQNELASVKTGNYATEADFCRLFQEKVARFYALSLLLTGDQLRAEECFSRSLQACLASPRVFKKWEERWAIHTIIKEAILMLASPGEKDTLGTSGDSDIEILADALAGLTNFDRCVYVMTVLENYSERECASFLGASAKDVRNARERAIKLLGSTDLLARTEVHLQQRSMSKSA